jgi:hypothetical protein
MFQSTLYGVLINSYAPYGALFGDGERPLYMVIIYK